MLATILAAARIILAASFFLRTKTTPELTLGSKLYSSHCASCHGAHLEGQPNWQVPNANGRLPAPPHDSSGHTWHHSDWELFVITKYGMSALVPQHLSDMPAFENILTDAEIRAILAFIKSRWPTESVNTSSSEITTLSKMGNSPGPMRDDAARGVLLGLEGRHPDLKT